MNSWIDLTNYGIAFAGLMVVLLGLIMSIFGRHQEKWNRSFFIVLFSLLIVYVGFDLLSQISLVMLGPPAAPLSKLAVFGESFFSSLLMPMLTVYLLRCTGEDWRRNTLLTIVGTLWLAYFALLIVTQFTTVIYTVTPDNVYQRGAWYPVLLIAPVLLMLLNLLALWHRRAKLTRQQTLAFGLYLLIPMGCMIVQMLTYGLLMIVIYLHAPRPAGSLCRTAGGKRPAKGQHPGAANAPALHLQHHDKHLLSLSAGPGEGPAGHDGFHGLSAEKLQGRCQRKAHPLFR